MPRDEDILEVIEPIADNRIYLAQLVEQLAGDLSVIPFVGAGMSVPFRLPAWGPFLKSLATDPAARQRVEELLADSRYEEAADYLHEIRGADSFHNLFAHTFGPRGISDAPTEAAVRSLARFPTGPVITTNFDSVLENVFAAEGVPFDEVVTASQQDRLQEVVELNLNALIKLHGQGGERRDRILTFADYECGYTSGPVRTVFENLASRSFLFLGCSLKTDRPVKVLASLVAAGRQLARHFAVLEKPEDEVGTRARLQALNGLKIRPIFYPPGRHELLSPLLELLASKTPAHRRRGGRRGPQYHNQPAPLSDILGRDAALDALRADLGRFRLIAVEGPRGIGKTTLVLHTLHRLKEMDDFEALVWTTASVVKSVFGVNDIVEAIALTLDFPFSPQTPADERAAMTLAELARKRVRTLIVVDNYENITDRAVDEFLMQRLPANCTVLLTSANAVPLQGPRLKVVALDELSREDALALFRRRAAEQGVDEALPADLEGVHGVTGGNPLAIEWVVGRVRAGATIEAVLASVREGSSTILDELFWTCWERLEEPARAVLCGIALFPTPPTQPVIEAVCGLDADACARAIRQLRCSYLVKIASFGSSVTVDDPQSRFVLHPITREFAERHTAAALGDQAYERAGRYFLEFVTQRGGTPELEVREDLRLLNRERNNIVAVLEHCRAARADALVVSLTTQLARWLFIEGHWSLLETWATHAIEAARRSAARHAEGRLWAELGRVLSHRSQFRKAEQALAQALALAAVEPRDLHTLGYAKHHLAEARIRQGEFASAKPLLEDALACFTEISSRRDMIGVRYRLAVLAIESGELDEAQRRLHLGIEDTVDEQWERLEGLHHRYLGELELRRQPPGYERARYELQRAARLVSETDTRTHALIELALARVEHGLGRLSQAIAQARTARDHLEKLRMRKEWEEADRLLHELEG